MKSSLSVVVSAMMVALGSVLATTPVFAQSPENHTNVLDLGRPQTLPYSVHPDTVPGYGHPVPGVGYPGAYYGLQDHEWSQRQWGEQQWREAQMREQELREQEMREAQRLENRRRRRGD